MTSGEGHPNTVCGVRLPCLLQLFFVCVPFVVLGWGRGCELVPHERAADGALRLFPGDLSFFALSQICFIPVRLHF